MVITRTRATASPDEYIMCTTVTTHMYILKILSEDYLFEDTCRALQAREGGISISTEFRVQIMGRRTARN